MSSYVSETKYGVVGWAAAGPNRDSTSMFTRELYALYVLPEFQKRSMGRKLVVTAAQGLMESGRNSMLLWVLADDWNARGFYEVLGSRVSGDRLDTICGVSLPEVAYGWKDLSQIAARSG